MTNTPNQPTPAAAVTAEDIYETTYHATGFPGWVTRVRRGPCVAYHYAEEAADQLTAMLNELRQIKRFTPLDSAESTKPATGWALYRPNGTLMHVYGQGEMNATREEAILSRAWEEIRPPDYFAAGTPMPRATDEARRLGYRVVAVEISPLAQSRAAAEERARVDTERVETLEGIVARATRLCEVWESLGELEDVFSDTRGTMHRSARQLRKALTPPPTDEASNR